MATLDSIAFDTLGFSLVKQTSGARFWQRADQDILSLNFFPFPPDFGARLDDPVGIAEFFHSQAQGAGIGLLEVGVNAIAGLPSIRTIFKQPQTPEGSGRTYVGSITLPFRSFSYVLKVTSREQGTTGLREAIVADELFRSGKLRPKASRLAETISKPRHLGAGDIEGWVLHPAGATTPPHLAKNVAEDERYDGQFPNHPLSRVRQSLARLMETIAFREDIAAEPPIERHPD